MTLKLTALDICALVGYSLLCWIFVDFDLMESLNWLAVLYRNLGFSWTYPAGERFSTLFTISLFVASIYLLALNTSNGWPRFKSHDRSTLLQSARRLLGYGCLLLIAVGLFGGKLKSVSFFFDKFEFVYVAAVALIFAGILGLIDDFLGALFATSKSKEN